jgi:hypothetical protein
LNNYTIKGKSKAAKKILGLFTQYVTHGIEKKIKQEESNRINNDNSILTIDYNFNIAIFVPDSILTKINQISGTIHKITKRGGANIIEFNSKLLPIIESISYYNQINNSLSNRYKIKINENIKDNIIIVLDKKSKLFGIINLINNKIL